MKKWILLSYIAAIFNPIPTGLLAGYILIKEKKYRKSGRNVLIICFIWIAFLLFSLLS